MIHLVSGVFRPAAAAALLAAAVSAQLPLTVGNLFVVRVGDGTTPLSGASMPTFVDEYTPGGALVQSLAMPTTASTFNQPLTNSGTATSEAFLNVSSNGAYLTLIGYGASPGTPAIAGTSALIVPRVIGRIDFSGTVDTSTALTNAYEAGNPRAVVSDDGFRFWTSGTGAADAGIRFVSLIGSTTSTGVVVSGPSNTRVVTAQLGQLFTSSASTVYQGISTVGTGLPTAATSAPITLLNGFPTTPGQSAYDYYFASVDTLYVADDRTNGSGGIQKWTQSGGTWTQQYTLALAANAGCRGLTGFTQGGVTTLWATANQGSGTQLVTVVDNGPTSIVSSLAVAAANTAFRGIRYLGLPSTLARIPATCGAADIIASGSAQIGTDVVTTVLNPVGFPFVSYGFTLLNVPFCNCTIVHDSLVLLAGPQQVLALPNNPAITGVTLLIQGIDFLAPGGCPDPTFTMTDGYTFTIQ